MFENFESIVREIEELEGSRRILAERLRFNSGKILYKESLERDLVIPVKPSKADGCIAAVDGGLLFEEFHGVDLLVSRAVAVKFVYENSKLMAHEYHPHAFPQSKIDVKASLESHEIMWHKSLFRLKQELTCAIESVKKFNPKYLMLDGSIVPLVSDKPADDSGVRVLYEEVIGLYNELYKSCQQSGCALVGVIKDSRGRRFIEIVQSHTSGEKEDFSKTNDTAFLDFFLKEGERTCAFRYSANPTRHQVLKDFGQWSEQIVAMYLKPVANDRPLRVEFLANGKTIDEIASLVNELSRQNKQYAHPAILIEADMRAALSHVEIERAYRDLFVKVGPKSALLKLRRNSRPFKQGR